MTRRSMTGPSRRDLLRAGLRASAMGAAATLVRPAMAAAPYRLNAGAFELIVISDGHLVLPTRFLAPDVAPDERGAALAVTGETGEQYHSPTNVTLIRHGTEMILVDAGSGPNFM